VRARDEAGRGANVVCDLVERSGADTGSGAALDGGERGEQAGVLLVARQDLVAGRQRERRQGDVDAVGGRVREGDIVVRASEQGGEARAHGGPELAALRVVAGAGAPALELGARALGRGGGRAGGDRPRGPGVQVARALEHRKLGAQGGGTHGRVMLGWPP
jgi:hypothetical protein